MPTCADFMTVSGFAFTYASPTSLTIGGNSGLSDLGLVCQIEIGSTL